MAKFLFVYRRDHTVEKTPETMQQGRIEWRAWIAEGQAKGWLLEPGDALQPEGRVVRRNKLVTDGPFAEAKEIVGGFSVIEAESFDAATALAHGCPVLKYGGFIEVRRFANFALGNDVTC
jgi:hypothetical protein